MLKTIKTKILDTWGTFEEKAFDKVIAKVNELNAEIVSITIAAAYLIVIYREPETIKIADGEIIPEIVEPTEDEKEKAVYPVNRKKK